MIALSHESWKFIVAETDDDHEWVPNTKQHSVMPNGTVTIEMVKGWLEFLDEAKAILKGEKLIPFWRRGPKAVSTSSASSPSRARSTWFSGSRAPPPFPTSRMASARAPRPGRGFSASSAANSSASRSGSTGICQLSVVSCEQSCETTCYRLARRRMLEAQARIGPLAAEMQAQETRGRQLR